uniref:Uncharacterized protein n=1 Tax=Ditylenchus dipsaci TaxID=166011 RepID=A0A915DKW0_9BILA
NNDSDSDTDSDNDSDITDMSLHKKKPCVNLPSMMTCSFDRKLTSPSTGSVQAK